MQARTCWRFGFVVAFAATILALYPQLNLWYMTGKGWNGIYAYNDIDEVAYAAYLSALMDGRPRRNDPYTGRDDKEGAPQPESLFSIQFLPPLIVAKVARAAGLSISWAMIALSAVAAFLSALVLFWLIASITKDEGLAAIGALAIICLGTLACAQGAIVHVLKINLAYPYLPFMRRYVPLFPFPLFFLMCGLVWKAISAEAARTKAMAAAGAGLVFTLLVYSYFYIWTTAAAWLSCLALVYLLLRPEGWRYTLKVLCVTAFVAALGLVPYAWLLSQRAQTIDDVQLLALTRAPDLARPPALICLAVLIALAWAIKRGRVQLRDKTTLFTLSLALTPYVVFNQQIITGRSLQPIHYEVFIANYVSVLALVLALYLILRGSGDVKRKRLLPTWAAASVALLIFSWGVIEAKTTTEVLNDHNVYRNRVMPVMMRLAEMAREPSHDGRPTMEQMVYTPDTLLSDESPTFAPQPVLWARHQHIFVGVDSHENRERFYHWMYYTGHDAAWLERSLNQRSFMVVYALFGWGRLSDRLVVNPKPLTQEEIDGEVKSYEDYIASFNREKAARLPLSYLILAAGDEHTLSQIGRWYEHDGGERAGDFLIYRLKLKP